MLLGRIRDAGGQRQMSGCSDPTCPSNKPEHFHIENWRLLGVPTYQYIVGDLNPGHITTGRVLEINEQEGWARTALYRVTLGEPAEDAER